MTTLAIIGGGIAGRSLIYALAKEKKTYSQILLFDSDSFAHTCSLRSTAIVAARGVTAGHSELGDLLMESFQTFSTHVKNDSPDGVFAITQYSAAISKLDQFKNRYPDGEMQKPFFLKDEIYLATENAYLIDTEMYLNWLIEKSDVKRIPQFVTKIETNSLETINGESFQFDHVVLAGGVHNQNWSFKTPSKKAQGSYLSFNNCDFGLDSFSLTLDGENLIYHAHSKTLLIGSTTLETSHELPEVDKLKAIYDHMESHISIKLPEFSSALILTGLREKAPKRAPYLVTENNFTRIGGFYKNGFSLGLHLGQKLARQLNIDT